MPQFQLDATEMADVEFSPLLTANIGNSRSGGDGIVAIRSPQNHLSRRYSPAHQSQADSLDNSMMVDGDDDAAAGSGGGTGEKEFEL